MGRIMKKIQDFFMKSIILKTLRSGMMATMPFLIIASVFTIIASLPELLPFLPAYSEDVQAFLQFPADALNGIISIAAVAGISYYYSKTKKVNQMLGVILSIAVFLLVTNSNGEVVDSTYLGSSGIFTAIVVAFGTIWILGFFKAKHIEITMPDSVPAAVADPFNYMISGGAAVLVFYLINGALKYGMGCILPELIVNLLSPLFVGANTIWFAIFVNVFINFMWFFGIHGFNIAAGVLIPVLVSGLVSNVEAAASGLTPSTIVCFPMFIMSANLFWFIPLMFMRCKSEQLKIVGKVALAPSIFNISEPIVFGAPLVGNITLLIPNILYVVFNVIVVYVSMAIGFLNCPTIFPSTIIPHPIFGYLATADVRYFLVFAIQLVGSYLIWLPFVKKYDKELLAQEFGQSVNASEQLTQAKANA
jgi:PTS system cellobiose-specific IIC component